MKTGTALLALGAAAALLYFGGLGVTGATVQFVFDGVQIIGITTLRVKIKVQNVSNNAVTLYALDGEVSVNGNDLGSASDFTPVTIQPTSEQDVNVDLDLSVLSLPTTIMSLLQGGGNSYDFNVTGNANVNKIVLPFKLDKTIVI